MNGEKNDVSDRSAGRSEKRKGSLMSVRELGETLGLKKTERYRLMHLGWFETAEYLGKMWVIRDSFEKWYANQTRYRKADGEEPGRELKDWSYSMRDIARMFGLSETTVYGIVERNRIETAETDGGRRVMKESFERWYAGQGRYRKPEDREKDRELRRLMRGTSFDEAGTRDILACGSDYLRIEEAMRLAGVSKPTLYKKIRAACFETVRVGRNIRIRKDSFVRWLETETG